ncbi:MAG: hypothetical protein M3408_05875, partial [Actinomycetota bacterium]|nr:hypothetical protein [Actinomycetota bacterium]
MICRDVEETIRFYQETLGFPFHETCQNGSWSRHLAEATLTHELSLPAAVPVAGHAGLT